MVDVRCAARSVAAAVCGLLAAAPFAAHALPPPEAFGQLPAISQVVLSPDGKHLAAIQAYKGRPVATIYDLDTKPTVAPIILPFDDGIIASVYWANNDRLLVTVNMNVKGAYDRKVNAWFRTLSIDAAGHNAVQLFSRSASRDMNYSASSITDIDLDDPDHVFIPLWTDNGGFVPTNNMFRVNVASGMATVAVRGGSKTSDWIMDGHGNVVARIDTDKNPLTDHLLLYRNDSWTEIAKYDATGGQGADILGLNIDGTALVQSATFEKIGTNGLVQITLADGKVTPVFDNPQYDIDAVLLDRWTGRVIGAAYTDDKEQYLYFDPKMEALQKGLEAAFPGTSVHAVSWNTAQTMLVVEVADARLPMAYYVLDRTTHQATRISRTYPELTDADIGEIKPYPYKARDGLDIPAYLTLPPGKTPKKLPTVIMPHGGPMARDSFGFDWMAQFLANRGYAVLQPNFRGSTGYGKKFGEAGFGEWGLKMQDDVTDGVNKLIADGIADPKRICIVGASYGGYASLAGAAFTPDLYACAASWAGVFDLKHFLSTRLEDYGSDSAMISSWSRFIGDRWNDSAKLDAASPAKNADKIKCPVLLIHGTVDNTVRIDQSEDMERALTKAGKTVTLIKIKGETHYMQTSATRIRVLTELEKFLKDNIGN